jgi:hypothetical protein
MPRCRATAPASSSGTTSAPTPAPVSTATLERPTATRPSSCGRGGHLWRTRARGERARGGAVVGALARQPVGVAVGASSNRLRVAVGPVGEPSARRRIPAPGPASTSWPPRVLGVAVLVGAVGISSCSAVRAGTAVGASAWRAWPRASSASGGSVRRTRRRRPPSGRARPFSPAARCRRALHGPAGEVHDTHVRLSQGGLGLCAQSRHEPVAGDPAEHVAVEHEAQPAEHGLARRCSPTGGTAARALGRLRRSHRSLSSAESLADPADARPAPGDCGAARQPPRGSSH